MWELKSDVQGREKEVTRDSCGCVGDMGEGKTPSGDALKALGR